MLRLSYLAVVVAALVGVGSVTTQAFASDVGLSRGGLRRTTEHFFDWSAPFSASHRFYRAPSARFARPAGVGVVFPFDYYPFYDDYPVGPECALERRPISSIYGLGWRNFIICSN